MIWTLAHKCLLSTKFCRFLLVLSCRFFHHKQTEHLLESPNSVVYRNMLHVMFTDRKSWSSLAGFWLVWHDHPPSHYWNAIGLLLCNRLKPRDHSRSMSKCKNHTCSPKWRSLRHWGRGDITKRSLSLLGSALYFYSSIPLQNVYT